MGPIENQVLKQLLIGGLATFLYSDSQSLAINRWSPNDQKSRCAVNQLVGVFFSPEVVSNAKCLSKCYIGFWHKRNCPRPRLRDLVRLIASRRSAAVHEASHTGVLPNRLRGFTFFRRAITLARPRAGTALSLPSVTAAGIAPTFVRKLDRGHFRL